jgi:hypothetical protein
MNKTATNILSPNPLSFLESHFNPKGNILEMLSGQHNTALTGHD